MLHSTTTYVFRTASTWINLWSIITDWHHYVEFYMYCSHQSVLATRNVLKEIYTSMYLDLKQDIKTALITNLFEITYAWFLHILHRSFHYMCLFIHRNISMKICMFIAQVPWHELLENLNNSRQSWLLYQQGITITHPTYLIYI